MIDANGLTWAYKNGLGMDAAIAFNKVVKLLEHKSSLERYHKFLEINRCVCFCKDFITGEYILSRRRVFTQDTIIVTFGEKTIAYRMELLHVTKQINELIVEIEKIKNQCPALKEVDFIIQ